MIGLTARDGHRLDGYLARPACAIRGGVVIAQEMYGLTAYLRSVCDFYAGHGYLTIAPALYDRRSRDLVYAYTKEDHDRAQQTYKSWDWNAALDDLDAGRAAIADIGKIGLIGFCWGGSLAWLAACRRRFACAVAYYGSAMPDFAREEARCPVIAHIGDEDTSLPLTRVERFRAAQPAIQIHIYEGAQHGFDNPQRAERYHAVACQLARERTLEFLRHHVG